jgi:hypothetical protein
MIRSTCLARRWLAIARRALAIASRTKSPSASCASSCSSSKIVLSNLALRKSPPMGVCPLESIVHIARKLPQIISPFLANACSGTYIREVYFRESPIDRPLVPANFVRSGTFDSRPRRSCPIEPQQGGEPRRRLTHISIATERPRKLRSHIVDRLLGILGGAPIGRALLAL